MGVCREEEQVQRPHLVVVPLSTFPNWEREFVLWAPQLNVVPFIGNQAGRNLVKQHELYADPSLVKGKAKNHSKHAKLQVAIFPLLHAQAGPCTCILLRTAAQMHLVKHAWAYMQHHFSYRKSASLLPQIYVIRYTDGTRTRYHAISGKSGFKPG